MANELTTTTPNGRTLPAMSHSSQVQAIAAAEEVKCLFLAAMQSPRNLSQVKANILEACRDIDLAKEALYSYRRGGQLIEGPSIDLMQEIACMYGRIRSGWEVVEEREGTPTSPPASKVRCFAIDIENLRPEERTIWVPHLREKKDGNVVLTDPRDAYELVANMAQRRKRACIEALIPKTIINAAVRQIHETLTRGGTEPLEKRARDIAERFEKAFQVTEPMLEAFLGCKVPGMTETQYVRLIAIAKSLKDGAKIENFFTPPKTTPTMEDAEVTESAEKPKPADKPKGGAKPPKPAKTASAAGAAIPAQVQPAPDATSTEADHGSNPKPAPSALAPTDTQDSTPEITDVTPTMVSADEPPDDFENTFATESADEWGQE